MLVTLTPADCHVSILDDDMAHYILRLIWCKGSKHAFEAFSDALRREMAPWGLTVSIIEPGFMRTPVCITSSMLCYSIPPPHSYANFDWIDYPWC
jgi:hypothetical protein